MDLVTTTRFQYVHGTIKKADKASSKNVEDGRNWCRRKNVMIVLIKVSVFIVGIVGCNRDGFS